MYRWIAVAAALAGALLFGMSAVAEQQGTKQVKTRQALSPRILLDLMRQPVWVVGVGGLIAGFALQVTALHFGSLALVQPLLVGDLVFAVLIGAYQRRRGDVVVFAGVAACTAGVVGFLAVAKPSGGHPDDSLGTFLPLAACYCSAVAVCLVMAYGHRALRPPALALATGISYGTTAFLIKLLTTDASVAHVFTTWPLYAVAIVAPLGFVLNQDAYQRGTMVAPVLAIITITDPLVSILLAGALLSERLAHSPPAIAGEVVSLALMIAGVFVVAYRSPQAKPAR
ncbi:MAG TPA: DMT family transporter [Trebonia sp.]|nr:DMT family transporter [Trebonia sp.]